MPPCIALLTDFGLMDTYVAAMKAVILAKIPSATILDLTHDIAQGDIQHGAFEIWRVRSYLPAQTILVGVVDPGVGTARRPITIEFSGLICVGPDNGLFSYLMKTEAHSSAVVELNVSTLGLDQFSSTFHGRDLFAPTAAHLASDTSFLASGTPITDPQHLPSPLLSVKLGVSLQGEILHIDHFGNLITSIGRLTPMDKKIRFSPWLGEQEPFEFSKDRVRIQIENTVRYLWGCTERRSSGVYWQRRITRNWRKQWPCSFYPSGAARGSGNDET
jgi:S-adenosylmethionine hydrolase